MSSNVESLSVDRRTILLGMSAAVAFPLGSIASGLPAHAVRQAAPSGPSGDFHIRGSDVQALALAEWVVERAGNETVQIAWGAAAVAAAPAHAARYSQKTFAFPTGTIRVLEFRADQGGMIHQITTETGFFLLRGAGTVEVAGRTESLVAGDVVSYPGGVLRGSGDACVILWNVSGTLINEAAHATVVRRSQTQRFDSAEWDQDGRRVTARTAAELAAAPVNAIRLAVERYEFPGNSVRVAQSFRGGPTSPKSSELDALIYVVSGRMQFTQDGRSVEVVAGDAIREIAGSQHYWFRHEDSSFVATSSLPLTPRAAPPR